MELILIVLLLAAVLPIVLMSLVYWTAGIAPGNSSNRRQIA